MNNNGAVLEELKAMMEEGGSVEASFEKMKQMQHVQAVQVSPDQAKQAAQRVQAVNMDEVNREVIHVKVLCYRDVPLTDDDGNPFCDEAGKQYMGREVAGTRTARIKNIAPIDVYSQAIAIADGFQGGMPSREQMDTMTDLILQCWQISEPFMTRKDLVEGVDGERLLALFARFFNKENPPSNASPSVGGNTTRNKG